MTDTLQLLGVPGVALVLIVIGVTGYAAAQPFRHGATWFGDLAALKARCSSASRPDRAASSLPHHWWPRCEIGPRMLRWPLNSTRALCARLWIIARSLPGFVGTAARIAWYPSAGLGALLAMAWATVLVMCVSAPAVLFWWLIDSTTVLRGGFPPAVAPNGFAAAISCPVDQVTAMSSGSADEVDWDRALAELVTDSLTVTISPTDPATGIRLGPDGQALDPAQQSLLDRDRCADLLDRQERLMAQQAAMNERAAQINTSRTAPTSGPQWTGRPAQVIQPASYQPRARSRFRPVRLLSAAVALFVVYHVGQGVVDSYYRDVSTATEQRSD